MNVTVHFSPDREHIISATDSDVILLANLHDGSSRDFVRITRNLYFQALTGWLDRKADYRRRHELAGLGAIYLEGLTVPSAGALLSGTSATTFRVEMEHG